MGLAMGDITDELGPIRAAELCAELRHIQDVLSHEQAQSKERVVGWSHEAC